MKAAARCAAAAPATNPTGTCGGRPDDAEPQSESLARCLRETMTAHAATAAANRTSWLGKNSAEANAEVQYESLTGKSAKSSTFHPGKNHQSFYRHYPADYSLVSQSNLHASGRVRETGREGNYKRKTLDNRGQFASNRF